MAFYLKRLAISDLFAFQTITIMLMATKLYSYKRENLQFSFVSVVVNL